MSETVLIGVLQVLATLLVFIAVESRLAPLPKGSYDRRGFVFFLELLAMGLMWLAILMGFAELLIPGEDMSPFSIGCVIVGVVAGVVMALVSIRRISSGRLRKAIDDQYDERGNPKGRDNNTN